KQRNKTTQYRKTKKKKQMWIPMPPETPQPSGSSFPLPLRLPPDFGLQEAQRQDQRRDQRLDAEQPHGMREIFRKHGDQRARCSQIPQSYPFECSARLPGRCCFAREQRSDSFLLRFKAGRASFDFRGTCFRTPGERCFIFSITLIALSLRLVHSAFSGLANSIRQPRCPLSSSSQGD